MTYYNERNGWIDNGKKITNRKCPNCGSMNFKETVSREYCPDCKLECDYWGGGSNKVYDTMMKRNWAEEERKLKEEMDRIYGDD